MLLGLEFGHDFKLHPTFSIKRDLSTSFAFDDDCCSYTPASAPLTHCLCLLTYSALALLGSDPGNLTGQCYVERGHMTLPLRDVEECGRPEMLLDGSLLGHVPELAYGSGSSSVAELYFFSFSLPI